MFHQRLLNRNVIRTPSPRKRSDSDSNDNKDHATTTAYKIQFHTAIALRLSTRRVFFIYLFFLLAGVYMARSIFVKKSGMTEVDLINELLDKSKNAYDSNFKPRQNRNPTTRPGYRLYEEGARANYPVVMIPGFITSGLELWDGEECARSYFRQRLWGSLPVFVQSFFTDNECWRRHLSLHPKTGLDPAENIRLRSAQGFEAADYVMSTFWVWEKVIENLADVGYDPSNMVMMPYDWRLSFLALEERDGYLTKLRYNIEAMVKTSGKKVVLTSHSMGSQIVFLFFKWVTTGVNQGGGGGGKDWVEKHIHSFVNIAGPMLGVPKAVTALLSGEMKDTAAIMGTMGSMVERIFGRYHRKELWKTWGSLWNMLPLGGDAIWSQADDIINYSSCVEDTCAERENGTPTAATQALITFEGTKSEKAVGWSVNDSLHYLKYEAEGKENSKFAIVQENDGSSAARQTKENWHDPTTTPLPIAPSMKIYCLYGVGIETERSYFYKRSASSKIRADARDTNSTVEDMPYVMDTSVNDPENNVRFGVKVSDGDVSVPLVSLGYMCIDGWKDNKRLNPSNVKVVTREYLHKEEFRVNDPMRGGPQSADHVDILGNVDTTLDLVKIATGFQTSTLQKNNIHSDIVNISSRVSSRIDLKSRKRAKDFLKSKEKEAEQTNFFLNLDLGIE